MDSSLTAQMEMYSGWPSLRATRPSALKRAQWLESCSTCGTASCALLSMEKIWESRHRTKDLKWVSIMFLCFCWATRISSRW